ncbi:hypothetical protein DI09_14p110 [Mitosporidium daphniae]|uniref:Polyadenylation factor subunit 2 n=1 Tax=Mitosporidium daphniae TaxID=1485682 RepID=A0A098VU22_9MICR|nr:uncharacterized protein DI09_14p110 [Mitosporidium daphniae]KGG52628.1 hypothetical protein DI09_14p110 [Mitosporidium daphniae]|eukprot:XP_013239055.1 uncharacterized protein DI09_14p110 [Mitosporidium daphniae]
MSEGGAASEQPAVPFAPKFVFDGKRMRKPVFRRTVDFNCSLIRRLKNYYKDSLYNKTSPSSTDPNSIINFQSTNAYPHSPSSLATTKFIHTSTNKIRCPVNVAKVLIHILKVVDSRRQKVDHGILKWRAHEQAVRALAWSHNGNFMLSGDNLGSIKYWQPNMNNVQVIQGHHESIRDLTFSPTDLKFASCSDDSAIKIWDFIQAKEERQLRGHGWDVKNVQWHPNFSLLASGSKDNTVRLWDPRMDQPQLALIHGHKNTVLDIKWNQNGKWLLTCGKDQVIKLYDIRKLEELQTFKGHKKDITSLSWHPFQESFFASGGFDGSLMFWNIGTESNVGLIDNAHEQAIWSMDWHPLGHILTTGSNDHTTKFWTRNRPGELAVTTVQAFENKYNNDL